MKITLKDGSIKEFENNLEVIEIAKKLSLSLAKNVIAAKVDDNLVDSNYVVKKDSKLELITKDMPEALEILNHSTAHLLAQAVKRLYPKALLTIGPTIEEGFYYDIDFGDDKIVEEDLKEIKKMMLKISNENLDIIREEKSKEEMLELFKDNPYKIELINELEGIISLYRQGEFYDLCRGVHVGNTKIIKHFELLSLAGAYWRGDSNNKMLTRIYGISFFTKQDLEDYLNLLEERKKRDHRKLGKELGLFMISNYGPGFPFWLPNGMILRRQLENFWYERHTKAGYKFVQTPIILNRELWEISGHWFNYKENMYTLKIDDTDYAVKPMNCPGGMLVYKNDIHSYKDLPIRMGELGLVHRHEASGALSGLFRVRNFTQDDAHIFMREDQLMDEITDLLKLFDEFYKIFNLSYHIELSTRPEKKYIGDIKVWDKAEKILAEACEKQNISYKVNPGDGAFYGPKLDFKLRDSMNRIWQCGTIQLDMNLPERFDLTYIDKDGQKKRPIMLHRAIFGSIERFIGILIEHYAGAFPTWLAPIQVRVIPVNLEYHKEYCDNLINELQNLNIRVDSDYKEEKLGYKIRNAQLEKIPFQLVIGDKEVENDEVSYRRYQSNDVVTIKKDEFIKELLNIIKDKR